MSRAPSVRSWESLPFFFDEGHTALGRELAFDGDAVFEAAERGEAEGAHLRNAAGDAWEFGDAVLTRGRRLASWMGARGLYELLVPGAQATGTSLSVRALCVVREAIAYHSPVADSVFAVQGLGSHAVVLTPSWPGRARFLDEVRRGVRIGAFALTEPEAGSDVASMRTVARRSAAGSGGSWVLDGEKVFISNAGMADHYIVFANADPAAGKRGISAFVVPHDAPGLSIEPLRVGDHPLGRVVLKGAVVPESALVGEVGHGMRLALGTLDVFRTSVGAAAVGMAQRAFDEALAHVRKRVQFGKPLVDFQLTQAALAEMMADLEASRLLVLRAAWAKDRGERAGTEVAIAKMFATEAAQRVIDRAVQLHGGLGVVEGSVVERLYKDIRPLRIYEGTTEIQKLIVGGALAAP
jgi:acyl-CoA dehydrogenase